MKLSGSGLDRADHCPASVVFPQTRTTTPYSSRGTVLHEFLMRVPKLGRDAALAMVPEEYRGGCERLQLDGLPLDADAYAAEVAYAYNITAGIARELGRGINRDYSQLQEGEIPGTEDVVGLTDDSVIIIDWKSGWADLGPVRENWQLRFGALAACRTYGKERAVVAIIRLMEDGEWYVKRAELDEIDLDATEHALRGIRGRIAQETLAFAQGATLETSEGPWCRYCPAFNVCPSKMGLVRQVLTEAERANVLERTEPGLLPVVLNAENAQAVYRRLEAAEAVVSRMWGVVKDYARVTPIDLGNGQVYGEKKHPEDKIDAEKALPLLVGRFGPSAEAAVEVKKTITKEALKDLIRPAIDGKKNAKGKRLTIKEVFETTWTELEQAGAARTTYSPRLMEHRPKVAELPPAQLQPKQEASP